MPQAGVIIGQHPLSAGYLSKCIVPLHLLWALLGCKARRQMTTRSLEWDPKSGAVSSCVAGPEQMCVSPAADRKEPDSLLQEAVSLKQLTCM